MRWQSLVLVALGSLMAADQPAVGGEKETAVKEDMKQLQGNWIVVSIQVNGKDLPQGKIGDPNASIKDDEYRIHDFRLRLTIDPTKKPKTIDMDGKDGNGKPLSMIGIYRLEGDTLQICLAKPGTKERPTMMETEGDTGQSLIVYKRNKEKP
jgi:uncharacterized protein (TIGR03067 family)